MKLKRVRGRRRESIVSQFRFLDNLCKERRSGKITEEHFIGDVEVIAELGLGSNMKYWIGLLDEDDRPVK